MAKNTEETPFYEDQITSGRLLYNLRGTQPYNVIFATPVEKGEPSNNDLIQALLGDESVMRPIINFVKGTYDEESARGMFNLKIAENFGRFSDIDGLVQELFNELDRIITSIASVKKYTRRKVTKVVEAEPEAEAESNVETEKNHLGNLALVKLKKNEPIEISNSRQLRITVKRENRKIAHQVDIERKGRNIEVTCPTSDAKPGRDLKLSIERGDTFILGIGDTSEAERMQERIDEQVKRLTGLKVKQEGFEAKVKSSEDAKDLQPLIDLIEEKIAELELELIEINKNPLMYWFTAEKSPDISEDHLIIELTDEGVIVVTDEGEKCTATLKRVL